MKYPIEIETEAAFQREVQEQLQKDQEEARTRYLVFGPTEAKQTRWRGSWRLLRSFLPLFVLLGGIAGASTVIIDQNGNVITTFPWPYDHDVVVPVPVPNILGELRKSTPKPTPAPTPAPTTPPPK